MLRDLAEKIARQPAPRGTGRYHYVRTSGSYLHTARVLGGTTTGVVEQSEREQWIAPDGSGRLVVTRGGESVQPTGDYPPGGLAAAFLTAADPDALTARLRDRNPNGSTSTAVKVFTGVWNNQVVPGALQRLLLLDLARHSDLYVDNSFRGAGVAVGHLDPEEPFQRLLVFDRLTGSLLGAETTALDGAGVPVPTPAVISRTEWLLSGHTTTTTTPPT
ncbi:hypothetical protein L6E12_08620 [Actinokineospora sp. PR83]|uniref:hypothetical protein n=1 Tax=Actinokineospora sp. PR83 TaxID=2884908 RepID=UPI001F357A26|nr:hypothetical protein [Actinokineospora sp. PR83]MCG8915849.1 hypothetical protein [Actinokineospora sp. PR83]